MQERLKELQEQHIKLKIRGRKNYVLKLIGETLINSFLEDEKQKMIYEMSDDEIVELVDKKFSVRKETAKTQKIATSELPCFCVFINVAFFNSSILFICA